MFPLLNWLGFVISIGGAFCFGMRRFGIWRRVLGATRREQFVYVLRSGLRGLDTSTSSGMKA
jgi:hypothetical protein